MKVNMRCLRCPISAAMQRRAADTRMTDMPFSSPAKHVHSLSSLCSTLSLLPASRQRLLNVRKPKLYGNYLEVSLPCVLLTVCLDSFLLPPSDVNLSSTDSLPGVSEPARGRTNCVKQSRGWFCWTNSFAFVTLKTGGNERNTPKSIETVLQPQLNRQRSVVGDSQQCDRPHSLQCSGTSCSPSAFSNTAV